MSWRLEVEVGEEERREGSRGEESRLWAFLLALPLFPLAPRLE